MLSITTREMRVSAQESFQLPLQQEDERSILDERGFVVIKAPSKYPTLHPVDLIREIAQVLLTTRVGLNKHHELLNRISYLSDEDLDIRFLSLLSPLIAEMQLCEPGSEIDLVHRRFVSRHPNSPYFSKCTTLVKEDVNGEWETRLHYNLEHPTEMVEQLINSMKTVAQDIFEMRKALKGMDGQHEQEGNALLSEIGKKQAIYLELERNLLDKEAELLLNIEVINTYNRHVDHTVEAKLWQSMGILAGGIAASIFFPGFLSAFALVFTGGMLGIPAKLYKDRLIEAYLKDRGPPQKEAFALQAETLGSIASYSFYTRSTGLGGCLLGKGSQTAGTLTVQMNKMEATFPYKINHNKTALSIFVLAEIKTLMLRSIQSGQATPEQCKRFVEALRKTPLPNSQGIEGATFINDNDVCFHFAPILCRYLIWDPDATRE